MSKALTTILVILLFIGFFEAGLISSYTIVTSEVPDIKGLIDMQIETISGLFNSENINNIIIKDPEVVNMSNNIAVADKIKQLAKVDGVNVDSMNATTYESSKENGIELTITAFGYASANVSSGQIVLSQDPQYQVIATAIGRTTDRGIEVDLNSIRIKSILNLYS